MRGSSFLGTSVSSLIGSQGVVSCVTSCTVPSLIVTLSVPSQVLRPARLTLQDPEAAAPKAVSQPRSAPQPQAAAPTAAASPPPAPVPPPPQPQQSAPQQQQQPSQPQVEVVPEPPLAGDNVMNVVFVGAECAPWSKTGAPAAPRPLV